MSTLPLLYFLRIDFLGDVDAFDGEGEVVDHLALDEVFELEFVLGEARSAGLYLDEVDSLVIFDADEVDGVAQVEKAVVLGKFEGGKKLVQLARPRSLAAGDGRQDIVGHILQQAVNLPDGVG